MHKTVQIITSHCENNIIIWSFCLDLYTTKLIVYKLRVSSCLSPFFPTVDVCASSEKNLCSSSLRFPYTSIQRTEVANFLRHQWGNGKCLFQLAIKILFVTSTWCISVFSTCNGIDFCLLLNLLDGVDHFHKIGWSSNWHFRRKYFPAWLNLGWSLVYFDVLYSRTSITVLYYLVNTVSPIQHFLMPFKFGYIHLTGTYM